MNEEEKQAIGFLKHSLYEYEEIDTSVMDYIDEIHKNIYKLILKQQKEIEELSIIKNSIQTLETHFVNDDTYYVIAKKNFLEGDFRHLLDDYIGKDKIKEIKEEYKKQRSNMTQIIFSKYGKTQQTFNQAVVNEVIKVLDEILGE